MPETLTPEEIIERHAGEDVPEPNRAQTSVENGGNLKPFTGANDPRRKPGRGRPSPLNDPEWLDLFAHAHAEGLTNAQLADHFKVSERSVRTYKKDPRVKNATLKHVEDRIIRITRRTDAQLDQLISSDEFKALPIEDRVTLLLKVRKETLGGVLRSQAESGKADAGTINEAMEELESNPELATAFRDLAEQLSPKA